MDTVLQPLIDAAPNNSSLDLEGRTFTLTDTVSVRDRVGLAIDNGTIRFTPGTAKKDRNTCILALGLCEGVTLGSSLVLDGGHPNASYDANIEGQHGVFVSGSSDCEIGCAISGVKGDGVYLRHSMDKQNHVTHASRNIITASIANCGRHGISVTQDVDDLTISANVSDTAHIAVDVEPVGTRSVPGLVITKSTIHGPFSFQGRFGDLVITHNDFGVISGKIRGGLGTDGLDGNLTFSHNIATSPKGDGSSQGLTVEGWTEADVVFNQQHYSTTKKNYQVWVNAQNVTTLHVDDNDLTGLKGHGFILQTGNGIGTATKNRNVT